MHPHTFGKPSIALRLGTLFSAVAATTVLVGSQLGIAGLYMAQTDTELAGIHTPVAAQQTVASAAKQPRS